MRLLLALLRLLLLQLLLLLLLIKLCAHALQESCYPWHEVEAQMRALADLAYCLGQYEYAATTYRLAAQDYLAAPNGRWYAGAEVRVTIGCMQLGVPLPVPTPDAVGGCVANVFHVLPCYRV